MVLTLLLRLQRTTGPPPPGVGDDNTRDVEGFKVKLDPCYWCTKDGVPCFSRPGRMCWLCRQRRNSKCPSECSFAAVRVREEADSLFRSWQ